MRSLGAVLLFAAAPLLAEEKPTPPPLEPLSLSEVVPVEGASATELYNRAHVWFGKTFRSAKNVLQVEDKETATLVGKGAFSYEPNVFTGNACISRFIHYTITVMAKDGRYKYTVTDFVSEGPTPGCKGLFGSASGYEFPVLTTAEEMPDIGRATTEGMARQSLESHEDAFKRRGRVPREEPEGRDAEACEGRELVGAVRYRGKVTACLSLT